MVDYYYSSSGELKRIETLKELLSLLCQQRFNLSQNQRFKMSHFQGQSISGLILVAGERNEP